MFTFNRSHRLWLLPALLALLLFGCAKNKAKPDPLDPNADDDLSYVSELKGPPSYDLLAKSLEYYEQKLGLKFRRNKKERFLPYSAYAWNHFSIADAENNCLYDVKFDRLRSFQALGDKFESLLDLKIEKGPCGISTPNVSVGARDRLQNMEGAIISKKLLSNIREGTHFISDRAFVQDALQVPYKVESSIYGMEPYLAKMLDRVEDPLDIALGDLVFFSEYVGEWTIGIYAGYGLMVTNCCFRTQVRPLSKDLEYRVYRIYGGFAQVEYKIHQDSVLHRYLSNPRLLEEIDDLRTYDQPPADADEATPEMPPATDEETPAEPPQEPTT
ncbi:MAG TPA: hypothetical protein PK961_11445 [bacterium]|nr:hypothetical protein [bacterium]